MRRCTRMRPLLWLVIAACGSSSAPGSSPGPGSAPSSAPAPAMGPATFVEDRSEPIAEPTAKDGSIGTAHPSTVQALAEDGSWLVICQARRDTNKDGKVWSGVGMHGMTRGDRLEPYLVLGSGAGTPIEGVVASSGDGRWVAVIRDRALEIVDVRARRRTAIRDADLRVDEYTNDESRAASIAANGSRMIYLRHDGDRDRIVVRDLTPGPARTRTIDVDGVLWRAEVDQAGRWAQVWVIDRKSTRLK